MAFGNGPRIVTNGLVLSLDAADRNSYPGSGTTWRDMSGNGNNGTLTNGPTFSSANGGSIVFDGTNDYATTNYIPLFVNDFCISFWVKFNTYQTYQNPVSSANDGNAVQGFWIEFGTARGFTLYNNTSLALEDNVISLTSLSTNIWYNVCVNRLGTDSNNIKLYIINYYEYKPYDRSSSKFNVEGNASKSI